MTRAEFKAETLKYLDVDGKRRGSETLVDAAFEAGCRDLCFYVPSLSGKGVRYANDAQVPFPLDAAEAVAEYVKERIARQVFRDAGLAREHNAQYRILRRRLYLTSFDADRDVSFNSGETIPFKFTISEDEFGLPVVSLNGYTFWFTANDNGRPEPLLLLSSDPASARDGPVIYAGDIVWLEIPAELSALIVKPISYSFQVRTPTGKISIIQRGVLKPRPPTPINPESL
jgi:hypothetical protein